MKEPAPNAEFYLGPGDFHFGANVARIHTLLGSCIAITLWHPVFRIGGMCHFMLPSRVRLAGGKPDGRYGDEAVELFQEAIARFHPHPGEYQVKLFGGGSMFQQFLTGKPSEIADNNIEAARSLLLANGFSIRAENVGGSGHRRIILDLRDGNVWVKHEKIPAPRTLVVKLGIANRLTAETPE